MGDLPNFCPKIKCKFKNVKTRKITQSLISACKHVYYMKTSQDFFRLAYFFFYIILISNVNFSDLKNIDWSEWPKYLSVKWKLYQANL